MPTFRLHRSCELPCFYITYIWYYHICDTVARNPSLVFFGFFILSYITLHLLQIPFTESKYVVSNWSYTRLIRIIKKVKRLNKKFKFFLVIIILRNHYFVILKLFQAIKGFILHQKKQMALKSAYNFNSCGNFMDTRWVEELQAQNPSSLFGSLAQYLGSDKQRVLRPCITYGMIIPHCSFLTELVGWNHSPHLQLPILIGTMPLKVPMSGPS